MAEAMRRDDAIYVARSNRVLPVQVVASELHAHDSARGASVARRAIESVQAPRTVLAGIYGTLVDHDVAIAPRQQGLVHLLGGHADALGYLERVEMLVTDLVGHELVGDPEGVEDAGGVRLVG